MGTVLVSLRLLAGESFHEGMPMSNPPLSPNLSHHTSSEEHVSCKWYGQNYEESQNPTHKT